MFQTDGTHWVQSDFAGPYFRSNNSGWQESCYKTDKLKFIVVAELVPQLKLLPVLVGAVEAMSIEHVLR